MVKGIADADPSSQEVSKGNDVGGPNERALQRDRHVAQIAHHINDLDVDGQPPGFDAFIVQEILHQGPEIPRAAQVTVQCNNPPNRLNT